MSSVTAPMWVLLSRLICATVSKMGFNCLGETALSLTVRFKGGLGSGNDKSSAERLPQPVFNDKAATDANFETITELLLENHEYLYSAIGSHNVRSQAHDRHSQNLIPRRRFEMQALRHGR